MRPGLFPQGMNMQATAISAIIATGNGSTNPVPAARPAVVKAPAPEKVSVPDPAELKQAMEAANAALRAIATDLEFSLDPSTGKTVVRVIDNGTQQVIRQFPSEEMLAIARAIDRFQGLLFRDKA